MNGNQRFPDAFASHRNWILDHLKGTDAPEAWIFNGNKWTMTTSKKRHQRIENLEYILSSQGQLGILRFAAILNSTDPYTILYLYDGDVFSHSIFQPMNTPTDVAHYTSTDKESWWLEPWSIEHLLS